MAGERNDLHDGELVRRVLAGDGGAFGLLVERYTGLVQSLAFRTVWDEETARELSQEAFLQAFLSLPSLKDVSRFRSWLYGIVLNICRSFLRSMKRDSLSASFPLDESLSTSVAPGWTTADPEVMTEQQEMTGLLRAAITGLSPEQQEVVIQHYYRHYSLAEISAQSGLPVETIKVRLHRARKSLRGYLLWKYPELDRALEPEQRRQSMVRVAVVDVVEQPEGVCILLLAESAGQRVLPVWIGQYEALSIALGLHGLATPRPMTYQFIGTVLVELGASLEEARVEALKEETFYGVAKLRIGKTVKEIDARPSDVLALAVRVGCPIFVGEEVMESAAIPLRGELNPQVKAGKGAAAILEAMQERQRQAWEVMHQEGEFEKQKKVLESYLLR